MKVSILIPSHRFRFLKEAVASVRKQTFTDYELIIVDDNPINDTQNWVKTLTDIRYYKRKSTGIDDNWRIAISYAKGQYIALFSDDDFWEPQFLEETVKALDERSNVGVACVHNIPFYDSIYSEVHPYINLNYRLFVGNKELRGEECIRRLILKTHRAGCYPAMLIRKECYEEFGYTTLLDTLARFFTKWDFYYIDKPLCHWRVWEGQDTIMISKGKKAGTIKPSTPTRIELVKYLKDKKL